MITADRSSDVRQFQSVLSMDGSRQRFVVLGGGIAGLATAKELLERGCQVTLIEKGSEVGGLARTFNQHGFRFDIGGHRFHSNNPTVVQWLKDLLKTDLLTVPRTSHIHLNGQFVDYPIQFPGALSIFSPWQAARMVGSYLLAKITERDRPDQSFEDWVVKRYGRALYEVFFKPYTEKVWGIPCHELSAAWAAQRISIPSFRKMLRHALMPPKRKQDVPATAISEFYYPRAGFGMIPDALQWEIIRLGGVIHTGASLSELKPLPDGGFEVIVDRRDGFAQTILADQVVSTLPLNCLLQSISGSEAAIADYSLEYRDLICLFLALKKPQVSTDSWTYFPSQDLIFGRTHEPKNWSSEMVPDQECTSLAVEIFASRGDEIWQLSDQEIQEKVVKQMTEIGWIDAAEVHKSWLLRVPYAYPVYKVGYEQQLQTVKDYLSQWQGLHLVGRTGSFHYMNSDGVIEDVFKLMEQLFPDDVTAVRSLATQVGRWM
jgi:protoporphyrinogen oxidase